VNPQRYPTQLLAKLPSARQRDLPAWLSDQWKRNQPTPSGEPDP